MCFVLMQRLTFWPDFRVTSEKKYEKEVEAGAVIAAALKERKGTFFLFG
jgi:hypothetical protein